ncbi:SpoVG family protein [Oscillibacter sp.]|uniref:SpoVG family protein n=1 Tax=Oscillibacter sp. TaxID=1945593 RepID=UPI001B4AA7BE|nr:SpoVG family protein [Oscillibacter sp.]MBP3509302.1 SpoVG family protein [Oscillibacter sp.]
MKQSKDPAQNPAPQERQYPPTEIAVKIHSIRTSGPVLANASVDLNGCFAIRGVKVMSGSNGPFVSMPRYKSGDEYKDVCFPCTKEFRQQFNDSVLAAYQQELSQLPQRQQESAALGQEQAASGPSMKM